MTETADYDKKAIPLAHTASHKSGGTDELDISGLVSKAHKASHQAGGADQISASGLVGRINLVDRGDPTPWDFTLSDFTTNGAWHDLPLDDIVPPGTICVKFYLLIQAQTIGNLINFRKKGNILGWNYAQSTNQVADTPMPSEHDVFCDSNRVIQYNASPITWAGIDMIISAWYI